MPDEQQAPRSGAASAGRQAQTQFRPLTPAGVAQYTDPVSFSRGQEYCAAGYIGDTVLRGATLYGESQGQSGGPYRVTATLVPAAAPGDATLAGWSCTCPRGGFCKHIVALLLLWIQHPDTVDVRADIATLLGARSREELLALLLGALQREPDLVPWIEAKLPPLTPAAPGTGARVTVDLKKIRRQATTAFARAGDDWSANIEVADALDVLLETGRGYVVAGEWATAAAVYMIVAEETIAHYEDVDDETGDVMEVIKTCDLALRDCLGVQEELTLADRLPPPARQDVLRTLYAVWKHELEYAGDAPDADEDLPAFLAHEVTPTEQADLVGWLRADLAQRAGSPNGYFAASRRPLVQFLLALRGPAGLTRETALAEYRAAGLYGDVAAQLIDLGRVDDAFQVAADQLTSHQEVVAFAGKLLQQEAAPRDRMLAFVEDRLARATDASAQDAYRRWLEERYIQFGMPEQAFALAQARFAAGPSLGTYASVKQAVQLPGQPADRWAAVRPALIRTLEQQGLWGPLVTIYLQEGEIPAALAALDVLEHPPSGTSTYGGYYMDRPLAGYELQVARAAEAAHPDRARAVYARLVERLIAAQGRENYQAAAQHLLRVRDIYIRHGQATAWQTHLADLRARHKRLRALKEELDRAGL